MKSKLLIFAVLLSLTACGGGSDPGDSGGLDGNKTIEQLAQEIEDGGMQADVNSDYMKGKWFVYNLGKNGKLLSTKSVETQGAIPLQLNLDGTVSGFAAPPLFQWKAYDYLPPIIPDGFEVKGDLGQVEGFTVFTYGDGVNPDSCYYSQAPLGEKLYSQYAPTDSNLPGNPYWSPVLHWEVIDQGFAKFVNFTIEGQDYPKCFGDVVNGACSCTDLEANFCQTVSPGSADLASCYAPKPAKVGEGSAASTYPGLGFPIENGANEAGFVLYTKSGEKVVLLKEAAVP